MNVYQDMASFRVGEGIEQGFAIGVDENRRVAFACAVEEIRNCPVADLVWSLNVFDYERIRQELKQKEEEV